MVSGFQFRLHNLFWDFLWFSRYTAKISLNIISQLVSVMLTLGVLWATKCTLEYFIFWRLDHINISSVGSSELIELWYWTAAVSSAVLCRLASKTCNKYSIRISCKSLYHTFILRSIKYFRQNVKHITLNFQRSSVHVCAEAWLVGPDTDEDLGQHRKKPEVV